MIFEFRISYLFLRFFCLKCQDDMNIWVFRNWSETFWWGTSMRRFGWFKMFVNLRSTSKLWQYFCSSSNEMSIITNLLKNKTQWISIALIFILKHKSLQNSIKVYCHYSSNKYQLNKGTMISFINKYKPLTIFLHNWLPYVGHYHPTFNWYLTKTWLVCYIWCNQTAIRYKVKEDGVFIVSNTKLPFVM